MPIADGQRFDVLQYWLKPRYRKPQLAKLAFTHGQYHLWRTTTRKALIYSSGHNPIIYHRNRLLSDIIGMCKHLRNWFRKSLLEAFDQDKDHHKQQ